MSPICWCWLQWGAPTCAGVSMPGAILQESGIGRRRAYVGCTYCCPPCWWWGCGVAWTMPVVVCHGGCCCRICGAWGFMETTTYLAIRCVWQKASCGGCCCSRCCTARGRGHLCGWRGGCLPAWFWFAPWCCGSVAFTRVVWTLATTTAPVPGFGKCMWGAVLSTCIWRWRCHSRGGPPGRLRAAGVGVRRRRWFLCQFTRC